VLRVRIAHQIECTEDAYWRCVQDDEYNRRLYLEAFGYAEFRVVDRDDRTDALMRTIYSRPRMDRVPAALAKLLGDPSTLEECRFEKQNRRYASKWALATLGDKISISAETWVEKSDCRGIVRLTDLSVDVKLLAVGWALERIIAADIRHAWEVIPAFTSKYIAERLDPG
jgi:hypothetical protein